MPWQAQLFIGKRIRTFNNIRAIFDELGIDHSQASDENLRYPEDCGPPLVKKVTLTLDDFSFTAEMTAMFECEGGSDFPAVDTLMIEEAYTDAIIGLPLTGRYRPSILDRAHEHGRPEPFTINLHEAAELLGQVQAFWPDAELLLWDMYH